MKKLIFLVILKTFFVSNFIFAQESTKDNKENIKQAVKIFCDCISPKFNNFSPEFLKTFKKMAKELQKKKNIGKEVSLKPISDYFQNNKNEYIKFQQMLEDNQDKEECELDLDDLDKEDDWLEKNYLSILKGMSKMKKCEVGYVIFMMIFINETK